jgi:hypothetical protein
VPPEDQAVSGCQGRDGRRGRVVPWSSAPLLFAWVPVGQTVRSGYARRAVAQRCLPILSSFLGFSRRVEDRVVAIQIEDHRGSSPGADPPRALERAVATKRRPFSARRSRRGPNPPLARDLLAQASVLTVAATTAALRCTKPLSAAHAPRIAPPPPRTGMHAATGGFPPAAGQMVEAGSVCAGRKGGAMASDIRRRRRPPHDLCGARRCQRNIPAVGATPCPMSPLAAQVGNDGIVRVTVPLSALQQARESDGFRDTTTDPATSHVTDSGSSPAVTPLCTGSRSEAPFSRASEGRAFRPNSQGK